MSKKEYKMVRVVWVDAEEHGDVGWNSLPAQLKHAKKPCPKMTSIGFEVFRDENHIALLSSIGANESSTLEKIPMGFVDHVDQLVVTIEHLSDDPDSSGQGAN